MFARVITGDSFTHATNSNFEIPVLVFSCNLALALRHNLISCNKVKPLSMATQKNA